MKRGICPSCLFSKKGVYMTELSFKEEDKQKVIDFLNIVAKNATFTMKTDELIVYFKLLSFMQNALLPKLNANILEIIKVQEAKPQDNAETPA
jgi:hypothetical protein